jgi:hypothetical protein
MDPNKSTTCLKLLIEADRDLSIAQANDEWILDPPRRYGNLFMFLNSAFEFQFGDHHFTDLR